MTASVLAPDWEIPSVGLRFGAFLLDAVIFAGVAFAVGVASMAFGVKSGDTNIGLVLALLATLAYFVMPWAWKGQTLGMAACGLHLKTARDGGRVGPLRALVRLVGFWISVSLWLISVIVVAVDGRHRSPADALAGTVILKHAVRPV